MVSYTIDASELKESEKVEELSAFLEEALGVKPVVAGKEITVSLLEDSMVPRKEVKSVLKRYLHYAGVKEDFRVLSAPYPSFKFRKKSR